MALMKSILLGSAAGIVAVAAAQAADLPTRKAAPAEYVKICNVGGMAGFVLPGSDTCFKISGYITGQLEAGNLNRGFSWAFAPGAATVTAARSTNNGPAGGGDGSTRFGNSFGWTTRANIDFDARQDTAYGVLRGYAELQFENGNGFDNTGTGAYINRAYVQWAGITAGKANSFFSFFGGGEGWANIFSPDQQGFNQPDLLAYTATFGGGFSATISAQSPGTNGFSGSGTDLNIAGNNTYLGQQWPDFVGALRVDQGWGAAQVSGVVHHVHVTDGVLGSGGYNLDKTGWGVLGGVKFNLPTFGPGDNFQVDGVYTENAVWYSGIPDGMWGENGAVNGNGLPMVVGDAWSNGNGTWATPKAWSVAATFEHHFSPVFSLDPEFSYAELHWTGLTAGSGVPANANSWIVGGVAHWDPVPHLDFAFEVLYETTHQSTPVTPVLGAGVAAFPHNADGVAGRFYVTRDF
jgi:Porin subfamily